jgi:hypothetical protein
VMGSFVIWYFVVYPIRLKNKIKEEGALVINE